MVGGADRSLDHCQTLGASTWSFSSHRVGMGKEVVHAEEERTEGGDGGTGCREARGDPTPILTDASNPGRINHY